MLIRSGECWRPYFMPDFRGKVFKFSLLSRMLAVGLS